MLQRLGVVAGEGLNSSEALLRLQRYGANRIVETRRRPIPWLVIEQFSDFMILVLLAAAAIAGLIGELVDTLTILVIIILNALIGAVQAYRAERAVAALKEMAVLQAGVIRDGHPVTLAAADLVPGDLVSVEAGNLVPADLRVVSAEDLQTDEAALTGESTPIGKTATRLTDPELPLGDRHNLLFRNSTVVRGRGTGVVVATGMQSEIGRIARLLHKQRAGKTPLQLRLEAFGRYLALAVLVICALVFCAGLLQGQPPLLMFLTAISLAVAAIPEALPAVVTIALAFGAGKLSRQYALARNLPAVETLGSVTVICSDKTGTLTLNRMTAERFLSGDREYDSLAAAAASPGGNALALAMTLNSDVSKRDGKSAGDPTELALALAVESAGFDRRQLVARFPRVAEIAFDSDRKLMTTLHQIAGEVTAFCKGAPELVLGKCRDRLGEEGEAVPLQSPQLQRCVERLAGQGYRVLAFAQRRFERLPDRLLPETVERELSFLGLVALIDPPRPEVPEAIAACRAAGIKPVMITGDHPGTALAIARRLGIAVDEGSLISGQALARLSDQELHARVGGVAVYARVSPEQKIGIVKALQARGEFVAMTGDGVNDAPALKRADIGVAMGRKGTDVAREAADILLLDDNFATIVRAVREGRRIFDNIRKFVKYTMTSNSGEIWTLFLAPFFGLPVPLLPIHILWINLVTDGLPGLAFSAEPAEDGVMRRPPRPPQEHILAHGIWQHILWVGLFIGALSIASQAWAIAHDAAYWQTVVFTVLTCSQLFHALAVRSASDSLFSIGLFSNPPLLGAVLLTLLLQLGVIYLPSLNGIFHTRPLPPGDLLLCFVFSSLVLVVVEIEKWLVRKGKIYRNKQSH